MDGLSPNFPDKDVVLSEDDRVQKQLSDLRIMFPHKKFEIVGETGSKRVEVVLPW